MSTPMNREEKSQRAYDLNMPAGAVSRVPAKEEKCEASCGCDASGPARHAPERPESLEFAAARNADMAFEGNNTADVESNHVKTAIRIQQMDCPTEETLLRKKLGGMTGVSHLDFNLMQRVLTVTHTAGLLDAIQAAVGSLGFTPEIVDSSSRAVNPDDTVPVARHSWWVLGFAVLAATFSEVAHWARWPEWLSAILAFAAVLASGGTTYKKGWIALRNANLNINALMSIAVTGALMIGQWPEAAMVMVLFTVAERIEARSLDKARNAIKGLLQLAPETATVRQADGSWNEMAAADVAIGSYVRVRPGERIALDGQVTEGNSSVNQSAITGESLPVEKQVGDHVYAGTINEQGSLVYEVTAAADNSTLARIIHAVEEAQGAKAPTQRFVDQFSRIYTPAVFALAFGAAAIPPLLMGGDWFAWVYKALVLLVIACPCALVISTPVTIVSGLAAAAGHGILIKGGTYLEEGRKLTHIALDKTGTLTHGKPVQTDFQILCEEPESRVLSWVRSLADLSDHAVSRAVGEAAAGRGANALRVEDFHAEAGLGTFGVIEGERYCFGNQRLMQQQGVASESVVQRFDALEEQGKTVVALADPHRVLAIFAVADTVRAQSSEAITSLRELGVSTVMLTGDNAHTAHAIAKQLGISDVRADLLPTDKLAAIEALLSGEKRIGMVGDGINDAPALARADIGFAMGAAGTDTAIETADVALMDDDLRKLPRFIRLSRATRKILLQNIVIALGIKAAFLALTLAGAGTMWMAVFADVGASLLVVGNGLRLARK